MAGQGKPDEPTEPKKPKNKGTKEAVHKLLSSGKAFTFNELLEATQAHPGTLTTVLSNLKHAKLAGPLGALNIVKQKSGHYQVVKEDGAGKAAEQAQAAITKAAAPTPPPAPAPAPPAASPSLTGKVLSHVPVSFDGGAPISSSEAGKKYDKSLHELNMLCAAAAAMPGADHAHIANYWKQSRSNLMAQYSADTTGKPASAKAAEVFPTDVAHMDTLAKAFKQAKAKGEAPDFKAAHDHWKAATQAAKAGKPAPASPFDAPAKHKPEPLIFSKPTPTPTPTDTPPTPTTSLPPPPKQLVPDDHPHITLDDLANEARWYKGMNNVKAVLMKDTEGDAADTKMGVQQKLTDRLKDSPAFQWLKKKAKTISYGSLEATLISTWAGSSGDSNALSCALQTAVKDVFNMKDEHLELKALTSLQEGDEALHKKAAAFKAGLRDFVLAQYHETQQHLKEKGITHLYLARGMKTPPNNHGKEVDLKLQPASSFSVNHKTAHGFAAGKSLYYVRVPASQALSTYATGFGCKSEHEVVILSHPKTRAIELHAHSTMSGSVHAVGVAKGLKKNK